MGRNPIQVKVISSSSNSSEVPELQGPEDNPTIRPTAYSVPRNQQLNSYDTFMEQAALFRKIAEKVVASARYKTIGYCAEPEHEETSVHVCEGSVYFRRHAGSGMVVLRSNLLKNHIILPKINHVLASSIFLDVIMRCYDFKVMLFCPRTTMICPFFPSQNIQTDIFRFESDRVETEDVVARWAPNIQIPRIRHIHVGSAYTNQDKSRCMRIYRQYFYRKVQGWQGEEVMLPLVNLLRRAMPSSALHARSIPLGHVVRWIKGWMAGLQGYTHITEAIFSHPDYRIHPGVFRYFERLKENVNIGERKILLKNNVGKRAVLSLNQFGAVHFDVYPTNGQPQPAPNRMYTFNINDIADIDANYDRYLDQDWAEYRNVEEYATMKRDDEIR